MRPDNLGAAAARRHELTRAKAIQALRELDRAGAPVTFASVAAAAGISRSWLYTQPDLRGQIQELRNAAAPPGPALPARQRASDLSLRARLTAALERNRQLAEENTRLRRQLARALGDQRTARLRSGNDQPPLKQTRPRCDRLVEDTVLGETPQVTASGDAKAQDNVQIQPVQAGNIQRHMTRHHLRRRHDNRPAGTSIHGPKDEPARTIPATGTSNLGGPRQSLTGRLRRN